jgi:hypothetical protein
MKTRLLLLLGLWLCVTKAGIARAAAAETTTWNATLTNRTQSTTTLARLVLRQDGTKLTGTATLEGKELKVEGTRNGAWIELVWTDANGRITQLRAVLSRVDARGTFISGGGGNLVDYGRVLIVVEEAAKQFPPRP